GANLGLLIDYDNTRRRWLIDTGGDIVAADAAMTIPTGTGAGTAARATTGLIKDSLYKYRVHAQQSGDEEDAWIESAQVTTFDVPTAPDTLVIAEKTDTTMLLTWADKSDDETGFIVELSDDGDFGDAEISRVIGSNITQFLFTGLTPGATYHFRVCAYNAVGSSSWTASASGATDAAYEPTEFEKWIRDPNIEPVYLAEVYTKMTLTDFTLESGVVWKKTISASDRGIDILEVFEEGTAYDSTPEEIA
ncbi:unnamed protein product, partial [marine sediment metagenome]